MHHEIMELHTSTVTHTYTYVTNTQLNIMNNIHTHIQFTIYFVTTCLVQQLPVHKI